MKQYTSYEKKVAVTIVKTEHIVRMMPNESIDSIRQSLEHIPVGATLVEAYENDEDFSKPVIELTFVESKEE